MINKQLCFELPKPWNQKKFETPQTGVINFLVGPNGSGKSKFAEALHSHLGNARLLGKDRLSGMEHSSALRSYWGTISRAGLPRTNSKTSKARVNKDQESIRLFF